jgi:hypothetical protein
VVFAGEIFGWTQALGMALVLVGVLAGQTWGARMAAWIGSRAVRQSHTSPVPEPALACATSRA